METYNLIFKGGGGTPLFGPGRVCASVQSVVLVVLDVFLLKVLSSVNTAALMKTLKQLRGSLTSAFRFSEPSCPSGVKNNLTNH